MTTPPQKNSTSPISRASLYPVSSLSLSRAPCLLEENELPVAQWQEYDKAFTCVSFFLEKEEEKRRLSFRCFDDGHFKREREKEEAPCPFLLLDAPFEATGRWTVVFS